MCRLRLAAVLLWMSFLLPLSARADWSPEITLWESPPGANPDACNSTIAVDAEENVHIAYEFKRGALPECMLMSLVYMKFDDHGNVLVPPMVINDSLESVTDPHIILFGADSLWVHWLRVTCFPDSLNRTMVHSQRSMDLNGHLLSPVWNWPDFPQFPHNGPGNNVQIVSTPDRKAVCVYGDPNGPLRCVVQNPDGSRIMNHTVVWQSGYWMQSLPGGILAEDSDSLNICFRQWWAGPQPSTYVAMKRICISQPFDTMNVHDSTLVSPAQNGEWSWTAGEILEPVDDSLIAFHMTGPGDSNSLVTELLTVVHRSDFSQVSQTPASYMACFEPDMTISSVDSRSGTYELHFRRFNYPSLQLIQDSLFYSPQYPCSIAPLVFRVSNGGTRHLILREDCIPNHARLIYRFWRSDLSVPNPQKTHTRPQFILSPNPVTESLTIEGPVASLQSFALYNILGQQVLTLGLRGHMGSQIILSDVSHLPSGIYFANLRGLHGTSVQKMVINH